LPDNRRGRAVSERHSDIARRDFLKTLGAAGLSSVFLTDMLFAEPNDPNAPQTASDRQPFQVPVRKLGKTGVEIAAIGLGANKLVDNQVLLRAALKWGVHYWDTAYSYFGGNSEICIGALLGKNPDVRKKLFISTKASGARDTAGVEKCLQTSLERMKTDYIDMYCGIHGCDSPGQLTKELKDWAEDAKKRKAIRFFGFSVHKNMPEVLTAAAKLGWVDVILTSYNFRLIQDTKMLDAVETCQKAGIGLIAMKTTGQRTDNPAAHQVQTEADRKVIAHFVDKGYTQAQAAIKAVLENPAVGSAVVGMTTVVHLTENAAAAMDKTSLTQTDRRMLDQYARQTSSGYCAGCAHICDSAAPDVPCISDVMRSLMYHNSYQDTEMARQAFAEIPAIVRARLLTADYSAAEAVCPQRMPIGKLVAEAVGKLA